jgi:vacuolar-type H+-ATPase subunit C/Vma6
MNSARLIYLTTRVHGLMTHLLRPDEIQKLVNTDTVKELAELLGTTDYSPEGGSKESVEVPGPRLEKLRAPELEEVFMRILVAMIKMLPENARVPSAESLNLYNEYNSTRVLEAHLDKVYYRTVLLTAKRLKDRDLIRLISMEIDVRNIMTLLTLNIGKVKPELVEHLIIPGGTLRSGKLVSVAQTGIGEIKSLLEGTSFAKTGGALEPIEGKMEMYRVEAFLLAPLVEKIKSVVNKSRGISYVTAYLARSEIEAKNLIAITMAKQLKLSIDLLQGIVIT